LGDNQINPLKSHCFLRGQIKVWATSSNLNFLCDFLKNLKENFINFLEISFLFLLGPLNKSYATLSSKWSSPCNNKINLKDFFSHSNFVFLSIWEDLIHYIWISDLKVMELFFLQAIIASS